ncbi:MAG: FRG domain-containing protein [Phycisphaerae bacterium]|nr:FRG domain-containing protein [Phycisphaerae bacterium]
MTWKDDDFDNVDDLFSRLRDLAADPKEDPIACRGQADSKRSLQTSLDRLLDANSDYETRLAEESAIIEKFHVLAREYLAQNALRRLEENLPNNKISASTIPQHYGTPTRLLDWTHSPYAALYFAAIHHPDKDGAVWWFRHIPFETEVHKRWEEKYHITQYRVEDLSSIAFQSDSQPWIIKVHCIITFHRIEVQQAFFTVAGRLGLDHADLIEDVMASQKPRMTPSQHRRIIVPGLWKQRILDRLKTMNIHSRSLDYPGADIIGNELTRDLRKAQRHANAD